MTGSGSSGILFGDLSESGNDNRRNSCVSRHLGRFEDQGSILLGRGESSNVDVAGASFADIVILAVVETSHVNHKPGHDRSSSRSRSEPSWILP